MIRTLMAVGMGVGAVLGGIATASLAQAQPVPPCAFTLSPPQIAHVEGVAQVTATVTPVGCAGPFRPEYGVACVHVQGGEGKCTQSRGQASAQVYFGSYQPGTTYVSSGRGCGAVFTDATSPECQVLGPLTATL
ncbi:hypothetical protein [Mycolicibacterium sp. XJ1819]